MSRSVRRPLAALGLMAALLFAAPAPSRAAGLWEIPSVVMPGIAARVRTWLEGGLPGPRRGAAAKGPKQGSGVDPNGSSVPSTSPTSGTLASQGSGVDPNGAK